MLIDIENLKRTYASVVRGNSLIDDERIRTQSQSSIDSGFEGLENMKPLDLEDLKRYQPKPRYDIFILKCIGVSHNW